MMGNAEVLSFLFLAMTGALGLGFVWPVFDRRRTMAVYGSLGLAMVGSLLALVLAVRVLQTSAPIITVPLRESLQWLLTTLQISPFVKQAIPVPLWQGKQLIDQMPVLPWQIRVDYLSAFFMVLIASFSAVVALYSCAALQVDHYLAYRHRIAAALNLFIWSTLLVVMVNDIFFLLTALELMTLSFGFLALYKHTLYLDYDAVSLLKEKNARLAGPVYMITSHASTAFLFPALLLLAGNANSFSFDALRNNADKLPSPTATIIFLLIFTGLGIRAGLTPAHVWVSLVHPSSPTPTHALSLGISIKVTLYLMLRCFFQFLPPQSWWGYGVVIVAVITALVNVGYAIISHDLKTALAYHSIENIGIMVAGIGIALVFADKPVFIPLSILALVASLYHLLNHAVFKGLLYLATGAIDALTGQVVEIEKLGGLSKIYPWTATAFLVGAVSIAGFPPFNGFISEWLILYSFLGSMTCLKSQANAWELVIMVISFLMLVASFALTAFCFVKLVGLTLLGQPRLPEAERTTWSQADAPWLMRVGMLGLSVLCLLLGVLPVGVVSWLLKVVADVLGQPATLTPLIDPNRNNTSLFLPTLQTISRLALWPVLMMAAFGLIALLLGRIFNRKPQTLRPLTPWNGGGVYQPEIMQYTGPALSFLIRSAIPVNKILSEENEPHDYLPARIDLSQSSDFPQVEVELFRAGYNWLIAWSLEQSRRVGEIIQNGDLRSYLFYIFLSNVVALLLFLFFGR